MDHVEFDFYEDFTSPLMQFLEKCGFELCTAATIKNMIVFPQKLFQQPESLKSPSKREQKSPEKTFMRCKTDAPVTVSVDLWK